MAIAQVILGVRDLCAATTRFESDGFVVFDGGVHPGLGTANRIVPLGDSYLELLGVVDEREAANTAFGRSLLERTAGGDRLVRWSIRTDDIAAVGARLALAPERRSRRRPDGSLLSWQAAGIELALEHAWLPFFMQWDRPGDVPGSIPVVHPNGAHEVAWLEIATPDPQRLARWVDGMGPLPVRVVDAAPGIHAAAITTRDGAFVIRP